ncbi:MAG: heavy-metal-associated domain-containing protein [Bacteriovoracaceae bacterium]
MKTFLFLVMFIPALSFADHIQVSVQGMVCSMCAQGIQKKFKAEASVSKVDVNLDEKMVHLETKGKNDLSDEQIKKVITEAGYSVKEISRK